MYDLEQTLLNVQKLSDSGFIGCMIPYVWFDLVTFDNGKPDLLGMTILADIVYWYRPTILRDESTGQIISYKKKFKADMLQRSVSSFAEQLGVSKRQVTDALSRLSQKQLIIKELRTIHTGHGKLGNVLFLAPNCRRLLAIQDDINFEHGQAQADLAEEPSLKANPQVIKRKPLCNQRDKGTHLITDPYVIKRNTYTETTTEITTKKTAARKIKDAQKRNSKNLPNNLAAAGSLEEKTLEQPQHTAISHTNTGNDTQQVRLEKTILTPEAEALINNKLTALQLLNLQAKLSLIAQEQSLNLTSLLTEVEFVLLDQMSFVKTGRDFHHKLNAIIGEIKKGNWQTPAKMLAVNEDQETQKRKNINNRRDKLVNEVTRCQRDLEHWKRIYQLRLDTCVSKAEQDNILEVIAHSEIKLISAQQTLNDFKNKKAEGDV